MENSDKRSPFSKFRGSLAKIRMPSIDTAKTAIFISTLSLLCSLATLHFSQIRTSHRLLAVITNFSIDGAEFKMEGDTLISSSRAHIQMALSNAGNTTSSLVGLFLHWFAIALRVFDGLAKSLARRGMIFRRRRLS